MSQVTEWKESRENPDDPAPGAGEIAWRKTGDVVAFPELR